MLSDSKRFVHILPLPESLCCPLTTRFSAVSHQEYSLLFDSAGTRPESNRVSIMLWSPSHTVTSQDDRTVVHEIASAQRSFISAPAVQVADDLQSLFLRSLNVGTGSEKYVPKLPFQVGVAGMIGYDEGRKRLNIPSGNANYAFPDVGIGLYQQSIVLDHASGTQFFCYVSTDDMPDPSHLNALPLPSDTTHNSNRFQLVTPWQSNLTEADYLLSLSTIRDYLIAGDCYQANFAQRFCARYEGDAYAVYLALRNANHAPFSSFMRFLNGAIISVSPERFLSVENNRVKTQPIKGTRPRHNDAEKDKHAAQALLASEKDRAENLMIVDLLRNDISKHCKPHSVEVPSLFALESYQAVHHMVSTVTGELDAKSTPLQLLMDAFPGGSITGAPKVRAMEIIDELEPHNRSIYCGSLFYLGWRGDMDSNICIRTLLADKDKLYCWAGGGIVIDSNPFDEYQETLDKVATILPTLENQ